MDAPPRRVKDVTKPPPKKPVAPPRAPPDCCELVRSLLLEMFADIRDNILTSEDERGDIMLAEFFINRMHKETVMSHVVKHVLPHDAKIREKDLEFFRTNRHIFNGMPEDRVTYYCEMFSSADKIGQENIDVLCDYFTRIITLVKAYKKCK